MARRNNNWAIGICAVTVLALFGSCVDDDKSTPAMTDPGSPSPSTTSSPRTTSSAPVPIEATSEWVGTVTDYDFESSGGPGLFIDLAVERTRVDLSHITALVSPATAAPTDTYAVTGALAAPDLAEGIAFSLDGSRAYVTHGPDGQHGFLGIYDTRTKNQLADIPVGIFLVGIAPTSDGSRAYVANNVDNTVSVIDLTANAVVATIPFGAGPLGVAVTPDGRKVYTSNQHDSTLTVIDTAHSP